MVSVYVRIEREHEAYSVFFDQLHALRKPAGNRVEQQRLTRDDPREDMNTYRLALEHLPEQHPVPWNLEVFGWSQAPTKGFGEPISIALALTGMPSPAA